MRVFGWQELTFLYSPPCILSSLIRKDYLEDDSFNHLLLFCRNCFRSVSWLAIILSARYLLSFCFVSVSLDVCLSFTLLTRGGLAPLRPSASRLEALQRVEEKLEKGVSWPFGDMMICILMRGMSRLLMNSWPLQREDCGSEPKCM